MEEDISTIETAVPTNNQLDELQLKIAKLERELKRQQAISSNDQRAHLKFDYDFHSDSLH
jgi:hypothetical protein